MTRYTTLADLKRIFPELEVNKFYTDDKEVEIDKDDWDIYDIVAMWKDGDKYSFEIYEI